VSVGCVYPEGYDIRITPGAFYFKTAFESPLGDCVSRLRVQITPGAFYFKTAFESPLGDCVSRLRVRITPGAFYF